MSRLYTIYLIHYNKEDYIIPQAKIEFMNKYKNEIENGRKINYHQNLSIFL